MLYYISIVNISGVAGLALKGRVPTMEMLIAVAIVAVAFEALRRLSPRPEEARIPVRVEQRRRR